MYSTTDTEPRSIQVLKAIEGVFQKLNPESTQVRAEYQRKKKVGSDTGPVWMAQFNIYDEERFAGKYEMWLGYYYSLLRADKEIKISQKGFELINQIKK